MKYLITITLFFLVGCYTPETPKIGQLASALVGRAVDPQPPVKVKEQPKPKPPPKTVILPRKLQQLNVSELKIGESGWIFHEALKVDGNNRCWVYKWASIKDLRPGCSQEENYIEIKRTSKGLVIGLVIVVKRKWDGETLEADHWYLPVAEVIIKYP